MAQTLRRITLEGGGGLEDVPAADIAEVIQGVVRAATRAAGHVVGRRVKGSGRRELVVAAAGSVRLIQLSAGSVQFVFAPAPALEHVDGLGFDAETIGAHALEIATEAAGEQASRYPDVARVWLQTAERLGVGDRYERITMSDDRGRRLVRLDREAVDLLRAAVRPPPTLVTSLVQGRVFEANFDARTAQLRGPEGGIVQVQYDEKHADDIYRVLRGTANLEGEVTYDPQTMRATRVRVREVKRPRQLDLSFWVDKPIELVISEQQLSRVQDPRQLVVPGLSTEDWEMLRAGLDQ